MTRIHPRYTRKEDRIIKQIVSENIGNLQDAFREAALKLKRSRASVERRYYCYIKPALSKTPSLKKLLISRGFFMISRKQVYSQGKNSQRAKVKPQWLNDGTAEKIFENL